MKKILLIITVIMLGGHYVYAQQLVPQSGEMIKAELKRSLANADLSRIFMKKATITDAQKPAINKLIADFLEAKRAISAATRKNQAAYQQQQTALFNTFKTNLSAVLSSQQMTAFLASKPAPDDMKNFSRALFY